MAATAGATWLVAGHVFATASHPGEPERGPDFLRRICDAVTVPVIAIGGIAPGHVTALRALGAHGVAVIRGIWDAGDAEQAAIDYLAAYDADGSHGRADRPDGERRASAGS